MSNPEVISIGQEKAIDSKELESLGNERREALRDSLDAAEKQHKNKSHETSHQAAAEAVDHAQSAETGIAKTERSPAEKRSTLITKRHREQSFDKRINDIQPHLTPSEQRFSKLIHNKTVEKTSDAIGSTIARPNALLAGSISAFILVTILYLVAKHYGYQLSGFETIGAFVLGWLIGLGYDYVRLLIRGKHG